MKEQNLFLSRKIISEKKIEKQLFFEFNLFIFKKIINFI
jgi:hypothetical protein